MPDCIHLKSQRTATAPGRTIHVTDTAAQLTAPPQCPRPPHAKIMGAYQPGGNRIVQLLGALCHREGTQEVCGIG